MKNSTSRAASACFVPHVNSCNAPAWRGTVLLFDEARRSLSLMTAKAQKEACENLLGVINRCNSGDMPGTMFIYAVMPSFFNDFATQYPALQQRCGPATRINLENLRGLAESDLLVGIGEKIARLAEIAQVAPAVASEFRTDALRKIADRALRRSSGDGTRRLLARLVSVFARRP